LIDTISKIARAKWTGGVAQGVEHLPSKLKALISTSITAKKKKRKKKRRKYIQYT
jgi:menaquinone-dependent protoporphyrinogen IX oxidase